MEAITKRIMLHTNMINTGAINAHMKWVSVFKKHLQKIIILKPISKYFSNFILFPYSFH